MPHYPQPVLDKRSLFRVADASPSHDRQYALHKLSKSLPWPVSSGRHSGCGNVTTAHDLPPISAALEG